MSAFARSLAVVLVAVAARSPAAEKETPAAKGAGAANVAVAHLKNAQGQPVGEAILQETPNGVLVTLKLHGLPPGPHALHVHEHGRCDAPFESAGGHFNPTKKHHGYESAQGPHAGDLPNVFVAENGEAAAQLLARNVTLAKGKPNGLLTDDGTALVVHAKPDDYETDPAGAAGDRIACGTVQAAGVAAPKKGPAERPAAGTR